MNNYLEFIFQIIICFILSFCIGFERQYRRRAIGLRTVILVCIGSFLFVKFSFSFPDSDMTIVAAQVVAGIGFLGAGVIIKDEKSVKGLTTAATLWCVAAIGILCSANLLVEASIGTFIILFTNIILRGINTKINSLSGNINYNLYYFNIICDETKEDEILQIIKKISDSKKSEIVNITTSENIDETIKITICISNENDDNTITNEIMAKLSGRKDITSISLDKKDNKILFEEEL